MIPPTLYAQSREADIAYKVLGDGLRDIVMSPAFASHLDAFWELPENAEFLERLSGLGRLILFDQRGTGLSDRELTGLSPEQRSEDLIAVMDAAGSAEAVLLGWLDAGAVSLLAAALIPPECAEWSPVKCSPQDAQTPIIPSARIRRCGGCWRRPWSPAAGAGRCSPRW